MSNTKKRDSGAAEGARRATEQSAESSALTLPLKGGDLHSERCVLEDHSLMAAQEQSEKSKHQQEKHCHVSHSFLPGRFRVNRLRADRILANHNACIADRAVITIPMLIAFAHLRVDLKLLIREAGGVLMTHSERPHSSLGYRAPNARSPEWRCDSARCVFFAVRFGAQAPPPVTTSSLIISKVRSPCRPPSGQPSPKPTICKAQSWSLDGMLQHVQLISKSKSSI